MHTIAIIGGGFCGTLVAIQLLQKSVHPLSIYLIDKRGAFAEGVAYSTRDPHHFLNVRASDMSAFPDLPDHFYQWLCEHEQLWRSLDPTFALPFTPRSFMPRRIYALYLHETLKKTLKETSSSLHLLTAEALDVTEDKGKLGILLSTQERIVADNLVIAAGVPTTKGICEQTLEGYTPSIWQPPPQSLLTFLDLSPLSADTHVAIIGSGLTMADAMMSLLSRGFKGKITALSKHGRVSEAHRDALAPYPSFIQLETIPETALGLFRMLRAKLQEAQKQGIDWRPVLDSLRPDTPAIWAKLSSLEKKRFLRHLFSLWSHHRHRLPPACDQCIKKALAHGQLTLHRGRFTSLEKTEKGLRLSFMVDEKKVFLDADHVLNCTGQDFAIATRSPFLRKLCEKNFVSIDDLGSGLRWSNQGPVYILGALLFGEKFETIAVPELRQQAAQVAKLLLST